MHVCVLYSVYICVCTYYVYVLCASVFEYYYDPLPFSFLINAYYQVGSETLKIIEIPENEICILLKYMMTYTLGEM